MTDKSGVITCRNCGGHLYHDMRGGLVHLSGSAYVMECPECGWQGAPPSVPLTFATDICPACGVQGKLQDEHVAQPGKP